MVRQSRQRQSPVAEEDRDWQERFWTVQRIGWLLMALLVIAALAGATGKGGPLSSTTLRTDSGTINYPRITRWQSSEDVVVTLPAHLTGDVELLVSPAFSRVFSIDSIVPAPSDARTTPAGLQFTFRTAPGGEKDIIIHVTSGKPVLSQNVQLRIGEKAARLNVTVLP